MKRHRMTPHGPVPFTFEEETEWDAEVAVFDAKEPIRKAEEIRKERSRLLAQTDWSQAADVPQVIKDKWVSYRQALRDVPQQSGFPNEIEWPKLP